MHVNLFTENGIVQYCSIITSQCTHVSCTSTRMISIRTCGLVLCTCNYMFEGSTTIRDAGIMPNNFWNNDRVKRIEHYSSSFDAVLEHKLA